MTFGEREKLRAQLRADEGLRLQPYRDTVGKLSIGYGRNLDDVGVSRDEAEVLLDNDVRRAEREVTSFAGFHRLNGARQAVIVNMAFNLGLPRLRTFKRMIAALERGDYEDAAREMLSSRWAEQVGERAERLARQMRTGAWA